MITPTPVPTLPRGIRNRNPGNIRHNPRFTWLHEIAPDPDGFCRFDDATFGLRALIITFHNYQEIHQLNTIESLITRWAPANENSPMVYAAYLSRALKLDPSAPFVFMDNWLVFTHGVVHFENGDDPYTINIYNTAYHMAITER